MRPVRLEPHHFLRFTNRGHSSKSPKNAIKINPPEPHHFFRACAGTGDYLNLPLVSQGICQHNSVKKLKFEISVTSLSRLTSELLWAKLYISLRNQLKYTVELLSLHILMSLITICAFDVEINQLECCLPLSIMEINANQSKAL